MAQVQSQQGPSTINNAPAGPRKLYENKPNEPQFQMRVEPECIMSFRPPKNALITDSTITLELKITNTTKNRQTFKVKCTNNEIFRVRPPVGFVKPDETAVLKVSYQSKSPPENNKHFFAIYHFKCDDTTTPIRSLWVGGVKVEGVRRIQAQFENAEGVVFPDGEKTTQTSQQHTIEKK